MYKVYYLEDGKSINYNNMEESHEFLIDLNERPNVATNIKINGAIYRVCMIMGHNNTVGVSKVEFNKKVDKKGTLDEDFICPYCGYVDEDAFELEDEGITKCNRCGSEIEYERIVTIEWLVKPKKKAKINKVIQ